MNRSKSTESAILHKWFNEAHQEPDSYLASFLTESLVRWVDCQIVDDLCPDLYGAYLHAFQSAREHDDRLTSLEAELSACTIARDHALETASLYREHGDKLAVEFADACQTIGDVRAHLNNARQEIITLKAKLYDLMRA